MSENKQKTARVLSLRKRLHARKVAVGGPKGDFYKEEVVSAARNATGATFAWGPFRPLAFSGPHTPPECEAPPKAVRSKFRRSGY